MSDEKSFTALFDAESVELLQSLQSNEELTKRDKQRKIQAKLRQITDSQWSPLEEALLQIEVNCRTDVLLEKLEKLPTLPKMVEQAKKYIKAYYQEQPEVAEILIGAFPAMNNIHKWTKTQQWKDEIQKRMTNETLFSLEKRHKMIESVYKQGLTGSAKHADMWLKMSGDLNKSTEQDPVQKTFENFTKALNKKRQSDE
jgi:hypothetical protein